MHSDNGNARDTVPSASAARLRERVKETLKIDLGSLVRQRRIESLQELRRSVVEAKRNEFLNRIQEFLPQVDEDEANLSQTETDMGIESDDSTNANDNTTDGVDEVITHRIIGRKAHRNKDISKILTWPEFIVATEREIRDESIALKNSLIFVRPEGERVLVVINKFIATEYRKDGNKRRSFKVTFSKGPTVLDCVVKDYTQNNDNGNNVDITQLRYFVLDGLVYNGCLIAHSELECRIFFLKSRLEEATTEMERPQFSMVMYHECTPQNMLDAYYRIDNIPYDRDSVVFVDKRANYIGGYNPNWLCWRDENTSKYVGVNKKGAISARVICDATNNIFKTLEGLTVGKMPRKLQCKRDMVITIMVKEVDMTQMAITKYIIPRDESEATFRTRKNTQPADSLRKIVRKFVMANQLYLDSETLYLRLVDAVAAVEPQLIT